jgi:hypothetical protein
MPPRNTFGEKKPRCRVWRGFASDTILEKASLIDLRGKSDMVMSNDRERNIEGNIGGL